MGPAVRFPLAAFDPKYPTVDQRLDESQKEDQHAADPEVERVQRGQAFGEIDHETTAEGGEQSQERDGGVSLQVEAFLEKGDHGLQHRHATRHGGNEQHEEPQEWSRKVGWSKEKPQGQPHLLTRPLVTQCHGQTMHCILQRTLHKDSPNRQLPSWA